MEFWEFLIQQEGDRSWLPLESPSVEVLEGRYRIVARSSRKNTATEVRVTHYATDATPPVRRVRKRSGQTNPEGLIVILPFTRLQPGLWELRCTGDVMAEMMGENWQYATRLEVLPVLTDWDEDWQGSPGSIAQSQAEPETVAFAAHPAESATEPVTATFGTAADQSNRQLAESDSALPVFEPAVAAELSVQPEQLPNPQESLGQESPDQESWGQDRPGQGGPEAVTAPEASSLSEPAAELPDAAVPDPSPDPDPASQSYLDELPPEWQEGSSTEENLLDAAAPPSALPALQVFLDREVFVIQRGETLALTGRIEFAADASSDWQPAISELGVRLYDPQTSQLLMDEVYPIDYRIPPFPFSGTVSLPDHYQTYLVLGELVFRGATPAGDLQVLATRSFNVTTDLHELIESIANDFLEGDSLPPEAQMPEAEPVPLAELNQLPSFRRSPQQPLPPQLRPQNPIRTHASLDLPSFGSVTAPPSAPVSTSAADLMGPQTVGHGAGADQENPTHEADQSPTVPLDGSQPIHLETQPEAQEADQAQMQSAGPLDPEAQGNAQPEPAANSTPLDPDADSDLFFEWSELANPLPAWQRPVAPPAPLSNKPEDISFRALNFQSRFWNRLQDLASRPEVSAAIAAEDLQAEPQAVQRPASGLDADLAAQEFVVEDGRTGIGLPFGIGDRIDKAGLPADLPAGLPSQADLLNEMVLPADEPIPTPRLQLPTGELTADQPIAITVKLPNLQARVYVKLWLRDRQTRTLLGTPRWLIDFVPDGFGNQMARTEVIVPPGSLKVQFEAVAVEIATQRESDKVSTTRPIVPPDLSPLSLDRLEI